MSAKQQRDPAVSEEFVDAGSDKVVRALTFAILFVIVCLLSLAIYAMWVGVFTPPAPRTRLESTLAESQAAVKANPGNGVAWAALAGAQYSAGDKSGAWNTLAQARARVKDRSILLVNGRELDFLLIEKKDEEVLKKVDQYIKTEAQAQIKEAQANAQKGIRVPDQVQNNVEAVRLFVQKATAQGNLGKWKEAVATLNTALQFDDKAADIIRMRGWARLNSGDKAGAVTDFKRVLMFMPKDPEATEGLKKAQSAASK